MRSYEALGVAFEEGDAGRGVFGAGQVEHRGSDVDARDRGVGEAAREREREVSSAAGEIEDAGRIAADEVRGGRAPMDVQPEREDAVHPVVAAGDGGEESFRHFIRANAAA